MPAPACGRHARKSVITPARSASTPRSSLARSARTGGSRTATIAFVTCPWATPPAGSGNGPAGWPASAPPHSTFCAPTASRTSAKPSTSMPSTSIGDRHGVDAEGQLGVQAWLNLLQVSAEALHDGDGVARNGVDGRPSDQGDQNETDDQEDHPAARATAGHHPSESILPLPNQLLKLGTASSPVAPRAALVAVTALGWHSGALPWFRRVG